MSKIIAVDFDGTLCVGDNWPNIGSPNWRLIRDLKRCKEDGAKLILWTCREGESLTEAVKWCSERGLIFDAINDNVPETIETFNGNCRKVVADIYIDDKAVQAIASVDCGYYGVRS